MSRLCLGMIAACMLAWIAVAATAAAPAIAPRITLATPFRFAHLRQPVETDIVVPLALLPKGTPLSIEVLDRELGLRDAGSGEVIPTQWSDLQLGAHGAPPHATVHYITDLPAGGQRALEIVRRAAGEGATSGIVVTPDPESGAFEVRTGRLGVRLGGSKTSAPPLLGVCRLPAESAGGAVPAWRGKARFADTGAVAAVTLERSAAGPVFYRHTLRYTFAQGTGYVCEITCWAGEDYITVREWMDGPGNEVMRWELDLGDWPTDLFLAGHGSGGNYSRVHLTNVAAGEDIAWLHNYMMWGHPSDVDLACLARLPSGPVPPADDSETVSLFQVRRGEWEDRLFAPYATTPLAVYPERDWSKMRWWGSPFGALRVARNDATEAGALFRFPLAPGRREWGLAVDSARALPAPGRLKTPPHQTLVKTAVGEFRLTEFQHYVLDWPAGAASGHPRILLDRKTLEQSKKKTDTDPFFAELARKLDEDPAVVAWRTKDAALANRLAAETVKKFETSYIGPLHAGLELAPQFSPVGIRDVFPQALRTDILLGTGLLDRGVERQLRACFALVAYRLEDSSFMAWKTNAGHPNFDADRYAAIAAVALLYPEHPRSKAWLEHAVGCFHEGLRQYVLPASGKWAENVGCYYDWSSTVLAGLAEALKHNDVADPYAWKEYQDFWRWSVLPLMPPKPPLEELAAVCAGKAPATLHYRRERPAPGDHGRDGGYPVNGGTALAGAGILRHDAKLGRELLWTWNAGGREDLTHYPHTLFNALDAKTLRLAAAAESAPELVSRRLAGYGAVLRAAVGKPDESYLLFKCGPGGYRYHGEEGSFVFFAAGQPLTLDGAENVRPDQHSTITFGAEGMGLRRGRLEQFEAGPDFDYACGRFPGLPEEVLPAAERPAWPRGGMTWNANWSLASPTSNPQGVEKGRLNDDLGVLAANATFVGERDVLTRQLFLRKNAYLVIRDDIRAVTESRWHLQLLAKTLEPRPGAVLVRGWLGNNAMIWLFHIDNASGATTPVLPEEMETAPEPLLWGRGKDPARIEQQRLTVRQPPGVSVLAVVDFRWTEPAPLQVKIAGSDLLLGLADGTTETLRLSGTGVPTAAWSRQGGGSPARWEYAADTDRLGPIRKVAVRDGMVYVNGAPFVGTGFNASRIESVALSPGGLIRWGNGNFLRAAEEAAQGKTVDLATREAVLAELARTGKYAVVIIEPYWGKRVDAWSQISWRGENRGGTGLNSNACWRNPEFIADRLKRVREVVTTVRNAPEAHERVLGFIVWNEQRWAWDDETCYCPHCRAAWPVWLAVQYGTIAALNREYGTAYGAFAEVPLPTPLPPAAGTVATGLEPARLVTNELAWRDFHLFKADGLIVFEKAGAAAAKAADPSRLVITSIFSRDVQPNIGHVMLRLYRELGTDPNIDVIGGNSYDVLPMARAVRHIEMWRSVPAAHAKPLWFTEFNNHAAPFEQPDDTATLNALFAHTAFTGASGVLWYTDRDAKSRRFSVLEPDGQPGLRQRQIAATGALMSANAGVIAAAAGGRLPDQVAIIHPDEWNALADNEFYNAASMFSLHALEQWAGFSVRYLAEPELRAGELRKFKAAVLWQAQRQADLSPGTLAILRDYVEHGGTLLCDLPFLADASGSGPRRDWEKMLGLTFANPQARERITISDPLVGECMFTASGEAFPGRKTPRDLGQWAVTPFGTGGVVADSAGHAAIVINPVGKGWVITCCFRLALTDPDPASQIARARLLTFLLRAAAKIEPLVDLPWFEKTLAPQGDGGLLVSVFNPQAAAVYCPLRLPGRHGVEVSPLRVPFGGAVSATAVTLPAGEWASFRVLP